MNIALTIPDKHVPELLAVIASMLAETQVEAALDPSPDHPELELDDKPEELDESRTEIAENDQTQQELPWNPSWPEPPPLPEGKNMWVYRGTFAGKNVSATGRYVYYLRANAESWMPTESFSMSLCHIEAV